MSELDTDGALSWLCAQGTLENVLVYLRSLHQKDQEESVDEKDDESSKHDMYKHIR